MSLTSPPPPQEAMSIPESAVATDEQVAQSRTDDDAQNARQYGLDHDHVDQRRGRLPRASSMPNSCMRSKVAIINVLAMPATAAMKTMTTTK